MNTIVWKLVAQVKDLTARLLVLETPKPTTIPSAIQILGDDGKVYNIVVKNKTLTIQ